MKKIDTDTANSILKSGCCELVGSGETSIKNLIGSLNTMNIKEYENLTENKNLTSNMDIINKTCYTLKNQLGKFLLVTDNDYKSKKIDNTFINLYAIN